MSSGKVVPFDELSSADLVVDAVYQSGRRGNHSDYPISHIVKVSNQGGFRYRGSLDSLDLVALVSSLNDPDWPDTIDRESGTFIYFGDNKRPGRGLHETLRFGNELLRRFFEHAHTESTDRNKIPPIFVFAKTGEWRDVRFIGLAVPGGADIENYDDLVAIWRTSKGLRFQNYRARFTILDAPLITRAWLDSLAAGTKTHDLAPAPWMEWREKGRYRPLKSVRSIEHRSKAEQLPVSIEDRAMISTIHAFFADRPHDFERCAAALARMMLPDIVTMDLTRPSRDGGRDGIGKLNIGRGPSAVLVDFALEAKCYGEGNSVGVREMSRLISRLRLWRSCHHKLRRQPGLSRNQGRPASDCRDCRGRHCRNPALARTCRAICRGKLVECGVFRCVPNKPAANSLGLPKNLRRKPDAGERRYLAQHRKSFNFPG